MLLLVSSRRLWRLESHPARSTHVKRANPQTLRAQVLVQSRFSVSRIKKTTTCFCLLKLSCFIFKYVGDLVSGRIDQDLEDGRFCVGQFQRSKRVPRFARRRHVLGLGLGVHVRWQAHAERLVGQERALVGRQQWRDPSGLHRSHQARIVFGFFRFQINPPPKKKKTITKRKFWSP